MVFGAKKAVCGFCSNAGYAIGLGGICVMCARGSHVVIFDDQVDAGVFAMIDGSGIRSPRILLKDLDGQDWQANHDIGEWTNRLHQIAGRSS